MYFILEGNTELCYPFKVKQQLKLTINQPEQQRAYQGMQSVRQQ